MRNPELLLQLLREMAAQPDGRIPMAFTIDGDERVHHMLLLKDAGHASWRGDTNPRITNAGYDFIEAYDKNPQAKQRFLDLWSKAVPYARAAKEAVELISS